MRKCRFPQSAPFIKTFTNAFQALLSLAVLTTLPALAPPLGTAFTYQGRLVDGGEPATGSYDFRFVLYTASVGGNQAGPILTSIATPVSGGVFNVNLDFGSGIFTGPAYWLEVGVRSNGATAPFTILVPRQSVAPTPYALCASNAGAANTAATAATATAVAANAVTASGIASGQVVKNLNGLKDAVRLAAGPNIALATNANTLTLSSSSWSLHGNSATTPATDFLGTTDNQPLQLRANNQLGLHLAPNGNLGVGTATPAARLDVAGAIAYSGQLLKLDVADNWVASIGAADLKLGHSLRRGSPGRALVDYADTLCVNFAADWTNVSIYGTVGLDPDSLNAGSLSPGLRFGRGSGEGIASKRTPGGNQNGLDFYQNFQPRLSIAAGGAVGIGTTQPIEKLEVAGAIVSSGTGPTPSIRLRNTSAEEWRITSYDDHKLLFWNGVNRLAITESGNVGINNVNPAHTLDVGGNIRGYRVIADDLFRWNSDGTYMNLGLMSPYAVWTPSDRRLKRDIQVITNAVDAVRQLRGVAFHWNDAGLEYLTRETEEKWRSASGTSEDDQKLWAEKRAERCQELAKTQRGFIAQEVERVFPEWVSTDPQTGYEQIDMRGLGSILVNAIKEQQDQLDAQRQRIHALEERLKALEQASSPGTAEGVTHPGREPLDGDMPSAIPGGS